MYEINSDNLSRSLEIKIWAHKFIWSIEKTNGKKHRGPSMMSTIGMRFPLLEVEYIPEVLPNLMNPEVLANLMKRVNHTDDKKFKKLNNLVFTKDKKEKYAQKALNNKRRK